MPTYLRSIAIAAPADAVYAWHARPGALERLLPPWSGARVVRQPAAGIADGARVILSLPVGPLRLPWVAVQHGTVPGRQFCDEQLEGPFQSWVHTHRMLPTTGDAARCVLEDEIAYVLPTGLGALPLAERRVAQVLERMFAFRQERTRADVLRHQRFAAQGPLRIAVTGAGGLLGRRLVPFLRGGGHTVLRLVRAAHPRGKDAVAWNPSTGEVDVERLGAADAVVHLAGESIAGGRWSDGRKAAIRASRVEATRALCAALARLPQRPRVLITASAVGYYGNRPGEPVREADGPGTGFLAEVCQAWEGATEPARQAGVRVVNLRLGLVVAAEGGALPRMLLPFRLGLGGRLGSGRQGLPWIAAEDVLGIVQQALFEDRLSGAINAVAPQMTRNADFTRALAGVLHRPALLPVPGLALRLLFGEMGQTLLLEGAQVRPARLQAAEFPFLYPDLAGALRMELGIPGG
jgi:uncharacterized protein (TIGR01777 family)